MNSTVRLCTLLFLVPVTLAPAAGIAGKLHQIIQINQGHIEMTAPLH